VQTVLLDYSSCEMSIKSNGTGGGRRRETMRRMRSR
jgi:hypothetical protein